jgi:hypothetical protein
MKEAYEPLEMEFSVFDEGDDIITDSNYIPGDGGEEDGSED